MITSDSLRAIPFFADFAPTDLDSIAAVMVERAYRTGEILFLEHQPTPGLFFVASGRVRVYRTSPDGKEQALCLMNPRACFGGCPLFNGNLSPVTAQAVDAVTIYLLPRVELLARVRDNPVMGMLALRIFGARLEHLTSIVDGLTFKCAARRLAERLLAYADEQGRVTDRGTEIDLDLTQENLASLIGCAREIVTRSLLRMERQGAIEARGKHIIILNRDKLTRVA